MDDLDRAQARELFDTAQAVKAQVERAAPIRPQLICAESGAVLCWDSNEPIPLARLEQEPHASLCVPCLTQIEAGRKARRV
jgi:RNA polymerase-binding transcription factor DksA